MRLRTVKGMAQPMCYDIRDSDRFSRHRSTDADIFERRKESKLKGRWVDTGLYRVES